METNSCKATLTLVRRLVKATGVSRRSRPRCVSRHVRPPGQRRLDQWTSPPPCVRHQVPRGDERRKGIASVEASVATAASAGRATRARASAAEPVKAVNDEGVMEWITAFISLPAIIGIATFIGATTVTSIVRWFFTRGDRTQSALAALYGNKAVKAIMHPKVPFDHQWDDDAWKERDCEVMQPALDVIECFASLANKRRWWHVPFYSPRLIERMASQRIVTLWEIPDVRHVVEAGREAAGAKSDTVYLEFELLVVTLKEASAKGAEKAEFKRRKKTLRRLLPA